MIKAIIFDFDGVILESTAIKTTAFRELFSNYPAYVDQLIDYHNLHLGVSRYVKFKYFFEEVLHQSYTDEIGEQLSEQYSQIVLQRLLKAPFVSGAEKFLIDNYNKYLLFIATGTPQDEIIYIVKQRNIDRYFTEIYGSPLLKTKIIEMILTKYGLESKEVIYVGDGLSDYKAAPKSKVHFVARVTEYNQENLMECRFKIKTITELNDVLKKINT